MQIYLPPKKEKRYFFPLFVPKGFGERGERGYNLDDPMITE